MLIFIAQVRTPRHRKVPPKRPHFWEVEDPGLEPWPFDRRPLSNVLSPQSRQARDTRERPWRGRRTGPGERRSCVSFGLPAVKGSLINTDIKLLEVDELSVKFPASPHSEVTSD